MFFTGTTHAKLKNAETGAALNSFSALSKTKEKGDLCRKDLPSECSVVYIKFFTGRQLFLLAVIISVILHTGLTYGFQVLTVA